MITCREVTDWLLEADLAELQSPADRAIAGHVAACAGCATRAARILGDTTSLAISVSAAPLNASGRSSGARRYAASRNRWPHATYVAIALLAASIVFVLVTRNRRPEPRPFSGARGIEVAAAPAPRTTVDSRQERSQSRTAVDEDPRTAAHRAASSWSTDRLSSAHAVAPVAVIPESVPAVAVRAVRLDTLSTNASDGVDARPSLAVDVVPSTGRYAVLGSTPKVTVVWFY